MESACLKVDHTPQGANSLTAAYFLCTTSFISVLKLQSDISPQGKYKQAFGLAEDDKCDLVLNKGSLMHEKSTDCIELKYKNSKSELYPYTNVRFFRNYTFL